VFVPCFWSCRILVSYIIGARHGMGWMVGFRFLEGYYVVDLHESTFDPKLLSLFNTTVLDLGVDWYGVCAILHIYPFPT
jgi:hypothetical protein